MLDRELSRRRRRKSQLIRDAGRVVQSADFGANSNFGSLCNLVTAAESTL